MRSGGWREALVERARAEIELQLDAGETVECVQEELIGPMLELSEDERAALWLFAWSYSQARSRPTHVRDRIIR